MHKLLERQLRRHFDGQEIPAELDGLVATVSQAYDDADTDRHLLEHAMELTSEELLERNDELAARVAEQERIEARLRRRERDLRNLLETASEGIMTVDEEGKIAYANDAMAEMLGVRVDDLPGVPASEFLFPEDAPGVHRVVLEGDRGRPGRFEVRLRRRKGPVIWAIASVTRVEDRGRLRYLCMLSDITERKHNEEKLRRAYEQLLATDEARIQFLNTAAHELGTPLTPLKLQLEVVKRRLGDNVSEGERRSINILERNVERLMRLVSDLLDSARLQSDGLRLDPGDIDMRVVCEATVASFRSLARERGVQLKVTGLDFAPAWVDGNRIAQVVDNLVTNAIKFTPEGGHVTIEVGAEADDVSVRVQDDGHGIRREDLARLFQPFTQVHDLSIARDGGTGLGLHICRGIIERSRGRIHAESGGLGQGATFWFTVPKAREA